MSLPTHRSKEQTARPSDPQITPAEIATRLKVARGIHAALATGVLTFGAAAFVVGPLQPERGTSLMDPLLIAAIATTIFGGALSFVLPGRMATSRGTGESALDAWQASRVLAAALVEGPALVWCVLLLLTGLPWLAAPIAVCLFLLAVHTPTEGSLHMALTRTTRQVRAD